MKGRLQSKICPSLMRVLALLAAGLLLGPTPAQALNHSGTISGNQTWYSADNPHIIINHVIVNSSVTLAPLGMVKLRSTGSQRARWTT